MKRLRVNYLYTEFCRDAFFNAAFEWCGNQCEVLDKISFLQSVFTSSYHVNNTDVDEAGETVRDQVKEVLYRELELKSSDDRRPQVCMISKKSDR